MIKTRLTRNKTTQKTELHLWMEKDCNEWELKELILFMEDMTQGIRLEKLDSTSYEKFKDGWKILLK